MKKLRILIAVLLGVGLTALMGVSPAHAATPVPFELCPERMSEWSNIAVTAESGQINLGVLELQRGLSESITISGVSFQAVDRAEWIFIAVFPARPPVELAYGPAVNVGSVPVGEVSKTRDLPILSTAPAGTTLTMVAVIREEIGGLNRRQSNWKRHPGRVMACVKFPVRII